MDKKKIIKWAVIVLLIIIVLIFVEITVRALSKVKVETIKGENLIKEKEKELEIQKEQEQIDITIETIITIIKNKEYDKLYSQLNAVYKEYAFPTFELFDKYMSERFSKDNIVISYLSNEKIGNRIIYSISYKVESESKTNIQYISISGFDNNYNIIFEAVNEIVKGEQRIENENVLCNYLYELKYKDSNLQVIEIVNSTGKNITVPADGVKIQVYEKNKKNYINFAGDFKDQIIASGESKIIKIYFPDYRRTYVSEADIVIPIKLSDKDIVFYITLIKDDVDIK